ncbi:UNVERIFIED_CONTAM: Remorin [Sesamum angustifolium]|uniref:Remorin n=1 Tax=Sesamum angustifolium TaxID=2727405 RepID=A0AAW2RGP3_9LAMI
MAAAEAEQVVSKKPEAEEPPLAAVMEKPNVDKPVAPPPQDDGKALAIVQNLLKRRAQKDLLIEVDVALAKLEDEKRLSLSRHGKKVKRPKWRTNDTGCAVCNGNRAQKKFSDVAAWENSKKASIESELKKIEEQLEKKKAEYAEKMKNKVALVHKQAEEKRAMVEARRGEEILKAEEMQLSTVQRDKLLRKPLDASGVKVLLVR